MLDKITLDSSEFGMIYHLVGNAYEMVLANENDTAVSYLGTVQKYMMQLAVSAKEKARAV